MIESLSINESLQPTLKKPLRTSSTDNTAQRYRGASVCGQR
jgi:hypothetical protein